MDDLNASIDACLKAAALMQDVPEHAAVSHNLGLSLSERYSVFGAQKDLRDAIKAHRRATRLTPLGRSSLPRYLTGLGLALRQLYLHAGRQKDLEASIRAYRKAVKLTSTSSPDFPGYMSNLA